MERQSAKGIAMQVILDHRGRVTIPPEYLQKLHVKPGDAVELELKDGSLRVHAAAHNAEHECQTEYEFGFGSVSLSEAIILERRERAARYLSMEARRKGNIEAALLLERYEKLARHLGKCATLGKAVSDDLILERKQMEEYLSERAFSG